jgi:hypothetical protein
MIRIAMPRLGAENGRKHGRVVLRIVAERKWLDALKRTANGAAT